MDSINAGTSAVKRRVGSSTAASRACGYSPKIARWRRLWRDTFTATPFWRMARAAFMPPLDGTLLPAALIDRFGGDAQDRLVALLRFLRPATEGIRMRAF